MSTEALTLPEGLTTRPLATIDSRIVFALITAQEREDAGEVQIEEADLVSDWAEPSHEVAASSVGVFDGDLLVGCAELMGSAGDRVLATLGYRIRWTSWILQLPEGKQIPPRGLPAGYTLREGHRPGTPHRLLRRGP